MYLLTPIRFPSRDSVLVAHFRRADLTTCRPQRLKSALQSRPTSLPCLGFGTYQGSYVYVSFPPQPLTSSFLQHYVLLEISIIPRQVLAISIVSSIALVQSVRSNMDVCPVALHLRRSLLTKRLYWRVSVLNLSNEFFSLLPGKTIWEAWISELW